MGATTGSFMRSMSVHEIAGDDIVRTHAEGEANERPPLVVLDPLIEFLDAAGIGQGELEISPIGDGHSNVTYAVKRGSADFILRRPPRGPLPPSAHDVLRGGSKVAGQVQRAAQITTGGARHIAKCAGGLGAWARLQTRAKCTILIHIAWFSGFGLGNTMPMSIAN